MNKNYMQILVVPTERLFSVRHFKGFSAHHEHDYLSLILAHARYMKRGYAENDSTHKQPIPYVLFVHTPTGKIFAYQRATNRAYAHEARLHGRWSIGIGGHIEKKDHQGNPLEEALHREINEEISFSGQLKLRHIGYINDETENVGKVHFGVLYIGEIDSEDITHKDKEIARSTLLSLTDLKLIANSPDYTMEQWSKIALSVLPLYL